MERNAVTPTSPYRVDFDHLVVMTGLNGHHQRASIALVLAEADLDGLASAASSRVEWAVWDKATPINGVPADRILARSDFTSAGEAYCIWIDDRLTFLQPNHPETGRPIASHEVERVAAQHAAQVVDQLVMNELVERARKATNSHRGT